MIKVHISPWYDNEDKADGGIRRVTEAMRRHLPSFGVEPIANPEQADVINNHGAMLVRQPGIPMVHTGHGLYWSRQPWGTDFQQVNAQVIESMRNAVAHTAPSEWVATALRRGGLFYPEVVYHGIDADDFAPAPEVGNFVLWNKAREDYVSNPDDLMNAALALPKRQFITTIGGARSNVTVLGAMPYQEMKKIVAGAGVYLATARETFGIGTLEALACGVPVAGWDWGGQHEIILPGETGFLAPPGDYKRLAECIELCFAQRERMSLAALDDVRKRWRWEPRIEQYAMIFKRIYDNNAFLNTQPKVSVIVTTYNLDRYLPDCLVSVLSQTFTDWECIVVDDAQSETTRLYVESVAKQDKRFRYCPTPNNFGLSGARNFGLTQAHGRYIRHLDADDMLTENALQIEVEALDKDSGLHVVYGHLEVIREDGSQVQYSSGDAVRSGWPPDQFSWPAQMAHINQLPSCVMARREVFERSGGYRERMKRAEDAEFWCRVSSLGFRIQKVTQAVTYLHRERSDSKGATEWRIEGQEPDWTAWFPWRMGATDLRSGDEVLRKHGTHPHSALVPFAAQERPRDMLWWYVHDYAYPVVSIIVTCGPGHKRYLMDALDSIQAQSYPDWECVVVNDTGEDWDTNIMGAPWAKIVNTGGNVGAAGARNAGLAKTKGKFIIWMDADDYWFPWYLEKMMAYAEANDGVIFSDLVAEKLKEDGSKGTEFKVYRYNEFECQAIARSMQYPGSSVLIPRKIIENVIRAQGGWDILIPGMEDWDFQFAIHALGYCAYHVPEPLFVYRMFSSTKRETDYAKIDEIVAYMDRKWSAFRRGEKPMGCGCGTKQIANTKPQSTLSSSGAFSSQSVLANIPQSESGTMVVVQYNGPLAETFTIRSRVQPGIVYRFGNNPNNKKRTVFLQDAEFLMGMTDRNGNPLYQIAGSGVEMPTHDPTSILGAPVGI